MRRLFNLVAILALAAGGSVSHAATVTDFGIVFTLTQVSVEDSNTRRFQLDLDTDGYTNDAGGASFPATTHWLDGVDIKVTSQIDALNSSLLSENAAGAWTFAASSLSASGCGDGGGGFACASTSSQLNLLLPGNGVGTADYSFLFEVTSLDGTFFDIENGAHIGASYARLQRHGNPPTFVVLNAGLTSETTVTPIPEPEIYVMMLAGLGLMGFVARRRRERTAAA